MSLESAIQNLADAINAHAAAVTNAIVLTAPADEKITITVPAPAEEPVAEEPVIEEPVAEEPVAEEPVAEEPVIEEPVIEEPEKDWDLKSLQKRTLEVFKVASQEVMDELKRRKAAKVQFLPPKDWADFAKSLDKIEAKANA